LSGGKLEANDSSMNECLVRELREELGVESTIQDIALVQELHKDNTRYVELIWHAIFAADPVIAGKDIYNISGGELTDMAWIDRVGMDRLDVKPEMLKHFI
jgi:8-oxo-dGTP pyrophosphatase MutT (NUDIX family)